MSRLSVFNRARVTGDTLPAAFRSTLEHGCLRGQRQRGILFTGCESRGSRFGRSLSPTLPSDQIEIQWLLPDGAQNVAVRKVDGSSRKFASGYNVYVARFPESGSELPKIPEGVYSLSQLEKLTHGQIKP